MNIDLHSHVKISKKTRFNPLYFTEMMNEAKLSGLDAIAMTEHFNTLVYEDIYETLDREYPYQHHYYEVDGLRVFPGIEIDIRETGHILMIGDREDILDLSRRLAGHTKPEHFIPVRTLMDWADEYNVLRIGAHPFRKSTPLHHLDDEILTRLDAFDMNGKDLYAQGIEPYRKKISTFAARLDRPVVGGSDTHQFLQYGSVMNTFANMCSTVDELKSTIALGEYDVHVSTCLETKVKSAMLMKKLIKQSMKDIDFSDDQDEIA